MLRISWSLEGRTERELMQEKGFGAKDLPGAGGVWLVISLNMEEMKLLVSMGPGELGELVQLLGKKSTPGKRYRY